ncbi:hypothetical protein HDV02_003657 [Globomyces sp. JEL0801]|nr:hypothetical protein HDV02_003657 [Globomyces sp. JEL0801]
MKFIILACIALVNGLVIPEKREESLSRPIWDHTGKRDHIEPASDDFILLKRDEEVKGDDIILFKRDEEVKEDPKRIHFSRL